MLLLPAISTVDLQDLQCKHSQLNKLKNHQQQNDSSSPHSSTFKGSSTTGGSAQNTVEQELLWVTWFPAPLQRRGPCGRNAAWRRLGRPMWSPNRTSKSAVCPLILKLKTCSLTWKNVDFLYDLLNLLIFMMIFWGKQWAPIQISYDQLTSESGTYVFACHRSADVASQSQWPREPGVQLSAGLSWLAKVLGVQMRLIWNNNTK